MEMFFIRLLAILILLLNCKAQTPCGNNVNTCQWSPWNNWQACQVTCGGGYRGRKRNICCRDIYKYDGDKCLNDCNETPSGTYEIETCNEFCLNGGTYSGGKCICLPGCSGTCCESGSPITTTSTTTTKVTSTTATTPIVGQISNSEKYSCGNEDYQDCHCVFGNKKTKIRKDLRDFEFGTYGIVLGIIFSFGTYVIWNCFDKNEFKHNNVKPSLRKFSTLDPPNNSLSLY